MNKLKNSKLIQSGSLLLLISSLEIVYYNKNNCIDIEFGKICGKEAEFYFYVFLIIFVISLILIALGIKSYENDSN